jgi:hypothetical protein
MNREKSMRNKSESTYPRARFVPIYIAIISLFLICSAVQISHGEVLETRLIMTPTVNVAKETGQVFDIGVDVCDVRDLCAAKIIITYNSSLLDIEQVTQGTFFPAPPKSNFGFQKNRTLGLITVDISLKNVTTPLNGSGPLFYARFKVIYGPEKSVNCPLKFELTSLLDRSAVQIEHVCVGAIYFWKSVQPDPPLEGRLIDLYTQNGGVGLGQFGGGFVRGGLVNLTACVTYNDYPVQQKLVGFEVHNPLDKVIVMRTAITNEDGLAEIDFRIPLTPDSVGTWSAIATVDIAEEVVWDTLNFNVSQYIPVGGYSTTTANYISVLPSSTYIVATLMLTLIIVFLGKKLAQIRSTTQ